MASLGDVTVELDLDIDRFRRSMRRMRTEMDGISQSTRGLSSITSMFKQGLGIGVAMSAVNGLVAGFRKLGSVVKGSISDGIEYNASLEQNTIAFEVMLGSMEEAEVMMGKIQGFADVTPFSTEGLVQSAKVMKQFGIETEKLMPNLEMLGDIALGDSEKLSRLTLAFSQIQSTGRLMGQDLLQLINAGFNPLQIISEETGRSMADLKDAMSDGAISAELVQLAFERATSEGGRFFQGMDKLGKSFNGRMSTLRDTMTKIKGALTKPFFDFLASDVIPKIQEQLNIFLEKIPIIIETAKETFGEWKNNLKDIWKDNKETFKGIWKSIKTVFDSIKKLVIFLWDLISAYWKTYGKDIMRSTKEMFENISTVIKGAIDIITGIVQTFIALFTGDWRMAWEGIINITVGAKDTLVGIFKEIANKFKLTKDLVEGAEDLGKNIEKARAKPFNVADLAKQVEIDKGLRDKFDIVALAKQVEEEKGISQEQLQKDYENTIDLLEDSTDWTLKFNEAMGESAKDTKSLKKEMEDLTKTIKNQARSFANFVGLFDKVKKVRVSAKSIFHRLRGQVLEMERWQSAVMDLKDKLGAESALFQEILAKGPAAAGETMAVSRMSDEQLAEYKALFGRKLEIGTEAATIQQAGQMMGGNSYTVNVTGNNIQDSLDVDIIADRIMNKLKLVGVY